MRSRFLLFELCKHSFCVAPRGTSPWRFGEVKSAPWGCRCAGKVGKRRLGLEAQTGSLAPPVQAERDSAQPNTARQTLLQLSPHRTNHPIHFPDVVVCISVFIRI